MSFTAYATAVAGTILTAAFWNQQVRDDGNVLKTSIDDNGHIYDPVIQTKTANYTIVGTDDFVICTANTFTVTLPTAVGRSGKVFKIKNTGSGVITVATTSAQTIDGSTTYLLQVQYQSLTVESDGSNWQVV